MLAQCKVLAACVAAGRTTTISINVVCVLSVREVGGMHNIHSARTRQSRAINYVNRIAGHYNAVDDAWNE